MTSPRITFFCELKTDPLLELFTEDLINDLSTMGASVSLGILDLTPERAGVVRRLNQAGVPLIAWLLLPKDQGYWFNLDNVSSAVSQYVDFKEWSVFHELRWVGVGLDIEPDIRDLTRIANKEWRMFPRVVRNIFDKTRFINAKALYNELTTQIRADGFQVDSYQFPIITDERKAGSTLLQRSAGLVDIRSDREVWMVYTSFLRPHGSGLIASYAPQAQSLGLGSTGGGVEIGFLDARPLTWEEFSRDLRLAWHWCDDIHIFSLEGCVQQGFLKRLVSFEWDYPFLIPERSLARVNAWRSMLRSTLWIGSNMGAVLLAAGMALMTWKGIRRFLRSKRVKSHTFQE